MVLPIGFGSAAEPAAGAVPLTCHLDGQLASAGDQKRDDLQMRVATGGQSKTDRETEA
jgi:hypothetical protein